MSDLFSHFVAARVPGVFIRDRRLQALLVVGTFLPDIAAKGLYWVLLARGHFPMPTHSILGVVLMSYLACLFIEERLRRTGFEALAAGGLIHLLVDLMKDNQGAGGAGLLFPFTTGGVELGWIDPENVVLLIPLDAAILAAAWLLERRIVRVQQ